MRYAIGVPNLRAFADIHALADLARSAERLGWDGFFIWEVLSLAREIEVVDATIALAAIATATERIRFGPMVTAPPRRRPQKLARETTTLDHLSRGRLILGVGLGSPNDYLPFGEDDDPRTRAERLDESLEIVTRLWSGERVSFEGRHFQVRDVAFRPVPVQRPRIPIWVGGTWPHRAPMRRAARWDGFFPIGNWPKEFLMPDQFREIAATIRSMRTHDAPFALIFTSTPQPDRPKPTPERIASYADAGVTWWIEEPGSVEEAHALIAAGPPPWRTSAG